MLHGQVISLKEYNTFNIDVKALCSFFCRKESELFDILENPDIKKGRVLVLGGGSNVLFTGDIDFPVIIMQTKGIEEIKRDGNSVYVKVAAGENWDGFVEYCVNNNYGGAENLSLIPGTVGASPVQNIGAYGVEVKDIIFEVEAVEIKTGKKRVFKNSECEFGYRTGIFKTRFKNQYIITNVVFKLSLNPKVKIEYGNLKNRLSGKKNIGIKDVRDAVTEIRRSKLPDTDKLPNAGSFFKNPVISKSKFSELKNKFPELVFYPAENGKIKLAAGQLIDFCGWKGKRENGAGVHDKQALVIINHNGADGKTILDFSEKIKKSVFEKFGVEIEREICVF